MERSFIAPSHKCATHMLLTARYMQSRITIAVFRNPHTCASRAAQVELIKTLTEPAALPIRKILSGNAVVGAIAKPRMRHPEVIMNTGKHVRHNTEISFAEYR